MRRLVYHNCYYPDIIYREKMSEIEELCKITNFLSALFFVFTEITKVGWSKKVLLGPLRQTWPNMTIWLSNHLLMTDFFAWLCEMKRKYLFYFIAGEIFSCLSSRCLLEKIKKSNSTTIENLINQQCHWLQQGNIWYQKNAWVCTSADWYKYYCLKKKH